MSVVVKNIIDVKDASAFAHDITKKHFGNISKSSRVIIKPNITAPKLPSTGTTTHHEVIIGVLEALPGFNNVKIVESDATSSDFKENIQGWGYSFLENYSNAALINLSKEPVKKKIILYGIRNSYEVEIPELLFNYDILINLPVMKTHILTGVSLGIKNLFGLLPCKNKSLYHINIHDILFAIYKRFQSDLTILDGIVGMEGMGPIFGEPANAKMILAGDDVALLDAVAARIMGFDPYSIAYLNSALKNRVGSCRLPEINVQDQRLNFERMPSLPVQIIRALLPEGVSPETILEQIDAPTQTIKNLPTFIESLISKGIIIREDEKLHLNTARLDILFSLFPETQEKLFTHIHNKSSIEQFTSGVGEI
ncbi:hypothetical protein BMS3Abin07_01733 [bacterium BMS3Abin07]|nr:hypothetical protein BMS3Abin07_01733 [bacterium BMS3Abin07]GBE32685.1 hypothetical protein BMS3Bbin05_01602 [bacterium BMS3Bbin05]